MFLCDYHFHTKCSFDSEADLFEMALAAKERGIDEIAVTNHADFGFNEYYSDVTFDTKAMEAEYREAKAKIEEIGINVRLGIEVGQYVMEPDRAAAELRGFDCDFILTSFHELEEERQFFELDYGENEHISLFHRYLEKMRETAEIAEFDSLCHASFPLRFVRPDINKGLSFSEFADDYRAIFEVLLKRGKAFEMNAAAISSGYGFESFDLESLDLYRSMGGELVTTGSDAHRPARMGGGIAELTAMMRDRGLRYITTYERRMPIMREIGE